MSRFTKQITSYWQQFRTVVRNEYGSIFTDAGVILVLVLALLIYSTLYSLAYGTQVLRNVPIGVIDMSNTSTSRQLINTFNAGPNVYVAYEPGDMDEAKHLFYDREIYGVVYIPSDYEEKLLGGTDEGDSTPNPVDAVVQGIAKQHGKAVTAEELQQITQDARALQKQGTRLTA